jgi:hypothetical protein
MAKYSVYRPGLFGHFAEGNPLIEETPDPDQVAMMARVTWKKL